MLTFYKNRLCNLFQVNKKYLAFYFSARFNFICLLRLLTGFCFGFGLPLTTSMSNALNLLIFKFLYLKYLTNKK